MIGLLTFPLCLFTSSIMSIGATHTQPLKLGDLEIIESTTNNYITTQGFLSDTLVEALLDDENRKFRSSLYRAIWSKILNADNLEEQIGQTELFTSGINDERVREYVMTRLSLPPFEKQFFSDASKEIILQRQKGEGRPSDYIKVLGVAELDHPEIDLGALSKQEKLFQSERANDLFKNTKTEHLVFYKSGAWSAILVKARRGDKSALKRIMDDVGATDKITMVGRPHVIEDLGYVRQPETVDLLIDYLFSDVPSPDIFVRGDTGIMPISFRAAKALSLSLVDFPADYWSPMHYEKIEELREFIRNYKGPWRIIGKDIPPAPESIAKAVEVVELTEPEESETVVETPELNRVEVIGLESEKKLTPWWPWVGAFVVLIGLAWFLSRKRGQQ